MKKGKLNQGTPENEILDDDEENMPERSAWSGKCDFILTCVGYAVGLGNIWRFPYLCYRSGGGAFFIPYIIFLVICALPLFFLEISYGQFASQSPITAWNICPLFRGIGIGMVIISGIVCIYYNVIVSWTIYYLILSFQSVLPWSRCGNWWNTVNCIDDRYNTTLNSSSPLNISDLDILDLYQGQLYNFTNKTLFELRNLSLDDRHHKLVKASEEFWENYVLQITEGIENMGTVRWQLLLCLLFAWFLVFIILFKGVKILGKVMHVAAPLPYFVLIILLIRGVTLPGAYDGIRFYFLPRWEKLLEFAVWGDAAVQIFYSVGPGWGGLVTMASFNKFHNNVYRDAMIVPFVNCATSVFAGVVIFSVLGFMAHETKDSIENVVTEGPGLTFVVYPEALSRLPISPLWAVLFFIMLFTVGLDSQFAMFETMLSAFMDAYPKQLWNKKFYITIATCIGAFIIGIPFIMQGGIYVLQIVDWYSACFSLMLITTAECLVIGWVYGGSRFYDDIELMIGFRPCIWWRISWQFITPLVTIIVWLASIVMMSPVTYGKNYKYPQWSIAIGWIISALSIVPLVVIVVYDLVRAKGPFVQRLKELTQPNESWGPLLKENRDEYLKLLQTKPYGRRSVRQTFTDDVILPSSPMIEMCHVSPGV